MAGDLIMSSACLIAILVMNADEGISGIYYFNAYTGRKVNG